MEAEARLARGTFAARADQAFSSDRCARSKVVPLFRLDPRSKFLIVFATGAAVFSNIALGIEAALFAALFLLLLTNRQARFALQVGGVYLTLFGFNLLLVPYLGSGLGALVLALLYLPRLVLLIMMAADLLMKTTSVSEFNAAFSRLHIPRAIIIPFSVMFRFIPTIKEEWVSIRNAMRLRGVADSPLSILKAPMQTLEYGLVPLLMSVATISSELAAASLSRGLDAEQERTCITVVKFRALDYGVLLACCVLLVTQVIV